MDIPPPGMVRNSGPNFDQTLNQPVHGPLNFFAPNIELPDHMQEVVSQNPHLQPGLVGLKPLAAGLVQTESILALLNPVFHIPPAVIDLGHLTGRVPGAGNHKAYTGEQLTPVPLDLARHPARPAPTLGLVVEINDLDLNAALGRPAHRAVQMRSNQAHQIPIGWQPDKVGDALFLAILIDFRFGKGGVAPKPEKLEPGPVALRDGLDELQSAIGGMNIPRPQPGPQTVTLTGKAKKRMETVLGKMAIVGNPLLLAVGRVLGGIQVDGQATLVF